VLTHPTIMALPVKNEIITQFKTHDKDTGSSEVQIALLTARINHLTEHLRTHRKDFHSAAAFCRWPPAVASCLITSSAKISPNTTRSCRS